jgi:predicted metalloprotease with PDZ domain
MTFARSLALLGILACTARDASAQRPRGMEYTLRVDSAGSTGVEVEMRVRGAPAAFQLAMATHAEYDDQYWRYVRELRGESSHGAVTVIREDSSLWRVAAPAGDVTIRYRVQFPSSLPPQQAAWKAHLTRTGGLIGGPHSFLYVPGGEHVPVRVTLSLPAGWKAATGLASATAPQTFTAPDAEALIDSPILVGPVREWRFDVDGVRHDVAYLGAPGGSAFDTTRFVEKVERFARAAVKMFGSAPYRRYQFLFEDGTFGALEHLNSVSIGAQGANIARDPDYYTGQIAHEFFHTWNEVRIRPASWIGLRHVTPQPTGELWFSEGVTLYYADLLLRRAGLHTLDTTRAAHLERLLSTYVGNPSQSVVSPERTSRAFNLQGVLGDYTPNMYTQGELLGVVLDLMIREGSGGKRSLDDAMRALSVRFTPARGINGTDIEHAVSEACACDAHAFFERYVRAAAAIDFERWLAVVGLRSAVTSSPARAPDGSLAPDARVSGYLVAGEAGPRLQIWFPATVWGRAGLHTGDRLVSWNGAAFSDAQQLRTAIGLLKIGDTVRVAVVRGAGTFETTVTVGGYERPAVRLEPRPDATSAQRAMLARWLAAR